MATIRRRTVLALTAGVWVMAIGSAATLAYALNRPLQVRTSPAELPLVPTIEWSAAEVAPVTENAQSTPEIAIWIPTITIVSKASRRPSMPKVESESMSSESAQPGSLPDISQMHCAEWRQLDMGSGRVQICE